MSRRSISLIKRKSAWQNKKDIAVRACLGLTAVRQFRQVIIQIQPKAYQQRCPHKWTSNDRNMTTAELAAHKAAGDAVIQVSLHSGKHEFQNLLQLPDFSPHPGTTPFPTPPTTPNPPPPPPPTQAIYYRLIIYSFIVRYPSFCIKSLVLFSLFSSIFSDNLSTITNVGENEGRHRSFLLKKCLWNGRSQWPRGLRRRSEAARLLGLWVRTPQGAWKSVSCEYCVLSGKCLYNGPITRPEE